MWGNTYCKLSAIDYSASLILLSPFFFPLDLSNIYYRDVKLIFTRGHVSLAVAFKGPNVISTP